MRLRNCKQRELISYICIYNGVILICTCIIAAAHAICVSSVWHFWNSLFIAAPTIHVLVVSLSGVFFVCLTCTRLKQMRIRPERITGNKLFLDLGVPDADPVTSTETWRKLAGSNSEFLDPPVMQLICL